LPDEAKKFMKTDANYKKIMEGAYKNPNVIQCCVKAEGGNRLGELKNISAELDKCQKSLTNYLESKKMSFPRFYFISDDDLLLILGSSDPRAISPHLLKLFDNCKDLIFGKGDKQVLGMISDEGEKYDFETPTKPEGAVEDWMNKIDNEMKKTIHTIVKRAVFYYAKEERMDWIKK
jgi:dynein heavy chain